jgi:hypothetical protein
MTHAPGMGMIQHWVESQPELAAAELVQLRARLRRLVLAAELVLQENLLDEALSGGHPAAEKLLALVEQEHAASHAAIPC